MPSSAADVKGVRQHHQICARIFYNIVGEVVEIIAVIAKSEAAIWLAREGILPEPDIPASGED